MAEELTRSLGILARRGTPRGAEQVLEIARNTAMPEPAPRQIPWRTGLALAAAAVILVIAVVLYDPFGGAEPSQVVTRSPGVTITVPDSSNPEAGSAAGTQRDQATESETATRGAIVIGVQDWSGVAGYRLLAVVWDQRFQGDLVGGAFWTLIDSDPYSGLDDVHPPYLGDVWDETPHPDGWGAGDYLWEETAWLEPGTYRIDFYANPGELAPYGSHLPSGGHERGCDLVVEVNAGQISTVTISEIPAAGGQCAQPGSS